MNLLNKTQSLPVAKDKTPPKESEGSEMDILYSLYQSMKNYGIQEKPKIFIPEIRKRK